MTITDQIKILNRKIMQNETQYDLEIYKQLIYKQLKINKKNNWKNLKILKRVKR